MVRFAMWEAAICAHWLASMGMGIIVDEGGNATVSGGRAGGAARRMGEGEGLRWRAEPLREGMIEKRVGEMVRQTGKISGELNLQVKAQKERQLSSVMQIVLKVYRSRFKLMQPEQWWSLSSMEARFAMQARIERVWTSKSTHQITHS